eukprot:g41940.t1
MILNKHMGHAKAGNSQTVQVQAVPDSSTVFPTALELMGSPSPSGVADSLECEMDIADAAALTPLPPEEEDEFLPRHSRSKRQATVCYTLSASEAELEKPDS